MTQEMPLIFLYIYGFLTLLPKSNLLQVYILFFLLLLLRCWYSAYRSHCDHKTGIKEFLKMSWNEAI